MGGCVSREGDYSDESTPRSGGFLGGGKSSGGGKVGGAHDPSVDSRLAAARAAEARAAASAPAAEFAARQELIGRITEQYRRKGVAAPFGLGSYPTAKLKQMYESNK